MNDHLNIPESCFSVEELDRHFRNMPDAFFLMHILLDKAGNAYDWRYVYANEAALENAGIPREDFIGKSFFELFGESGDAKWLKPYYEAAFEGKSRVFDDYSPEVHRFVQVTCFQYEYGYAACFVRDVTMSHIHEKALQSAALSYREMYFVDLESDYYQQVYPMPEAYEELGSYREAVDRHFSSGKIVLEDEENVRRFLSAEYVRGRLEAQDYIEYKYYRRSPRGVPEWCLVSFTAGERKKDGTPVTAVMGIRSIDRLVREELERREELQRAVEAAEKANHAKSDFLSTMSHDMRTPLNIVIGMTTLARLHQDDPVQVLDCMDKIETSGKHLLALVNQVLDMAKIESGEMVLHEGAFTMPALMEQVTQMANGILTNRQHVLNFGMKNFHHENVIGDENRLMQVLLNLLSNASKYSDPGSRILVELEELPSKQSGQGQYRFAVTDNGRGMSPEYLERIFEPFSREEDSRLSQVQGTGLGMTITQQIVKKMGGTISVTSRQGKGSTFVVEVPLKLQDQQVEQVCFPEERVLVVDDYPDCIASICAVLDTMEVEHVCTQSGREALQVLEESKEQGKTFTCALLDYKMPDMDGLKLAEEIRKRCGREMRIGLVSAYDYSPIRWEAEDAGIDFFCQKPVFRSNLMHLFQNLRAGEQESAAEREQASKTIRHYALIAEDNGINAMIAARMLEHFGFRSAIAENGEKAVEAIRSSAPGTFDCIFMDVQMPVMDGLAAAQAIRALEHADADIPIFAMTANVFTDDVERTRQAGMQEHIAKPIELEQLRTVLRKWFQGQMRGL